MIIKPGSSKDLFPRDRPMYYVLKGKEPFPCNDIFEWMLAMKGNDMEIGKKVAHDTIGKISVSTIFLSIDHGWFGENPVLFETMVFGGALDGEQFRYCTWEQAEAGHKEMVALVRKNNTLMAVLKNSIIKLWQYLMK